MRPQAVLVALTESGYNSACHAWLETFAENGPVNTDELVRMIFGVLLASVPFVLVIWLIGSIATIKSSLRSLANDSAKMRALLGEIRDRLGK
jgi:hypothetical protein